MPGSVKTEAVVLRSIRYGEADRILHLYSATRGKVGAIAKGSRRPKSRFGGRLEPFFRLDLVLYEGRGELLTVTGASTVDGYGRLRCDGEALMAAGRGCDAVLRLFGEGEPNKPAYNLLCSYLALLDADPAAASAPGPGARLPAEAGAGGGVLARAGELRPLRRGRAPQRRSRARPAASSARAARARASRSPRRPTASWSRPWRGRSRRRRRPSARSRRWPTARSIETLEHHAHVQLRAAA